jgi:hypothetical protein
MAPRKAKRHYVDNEEFYQAMVEYKASVNEAIEKGLPRPRVSNYIGECIMKIAVHRSYSPNFSQYPFRNEMISDAIENCLQYIDNFDPENAKKNAFGYFNQIIFFAFLRRIEKEKKELYVKLKLTESAQMMNTTADQATGHSYDVAGSHNEWSQEYVSNFINDFEESKRKKREPSKKD